MDMYSGFIRNLTKRLQHLKIKVKIRFSVSKLSPCLFLCSGGRHGGEFPIWERLCLHHGGPDAAVRRPRKASGQRHQPHQGGEEEGQRQTGEGEEETRWREGKGKREGKTKERNAEGTWRHVQVKKRF